MSRPTIVAKYTGGAAPGGSTAFTISVPNVLVGDWLVVCQATLYSPAPGYTMPTPTGSGTGTYTEIGSRVGDASANANADLRAWYKNCTSAGTHTVSFTDDGTDSENMAVVLHLRGCTAIDGTPTEAEAPQTVTSTSQSVPGVTTTTPDALLLGFWTGVQFSGTYTYPAPPPSGMTEEAEKAVNSFAAVMCASQALTAAGATGARVATSSPAASAGWAAKLFAISGPQSGPPIVDAGADATLALGETLTRTAVENANGSPISARQWSTVAPSTPGALLNIGPSGGQNHFSVQVAPTGATAIETHTQAEIAGGYSASPYFTPNGAGTATQFWARIDGPTTSGSQYARCELREVDAAGNNYTFNATTGEHVLQGRTTITHLPPAKPEVVIGQMFSETASTDMASFRTQLVSGTIRLRARFNGTSITSPQLSGSYAPGTEFRWKIRAAGGVCEFYWSFGNDPLPDTPQITTAAIPAGSYYFKSGCYLQSNTTTDVATEWGSAELRELQHWHTGWPTPQLAPVPGGGDVLSTAAALSWTPTSVGTYRLRYSATNGLGTTTDDMTVTVNPPPVQPVNLTESGTGTEAVAISADTGPLTDAGTGSDAIAVETLTLVGLADEGSGADAVVVDEFIAKPLTDSGTGTEAVAVEQTTYVNLTDSGTGTDALANRQDYSVTDSGTGTDALVSGLRTGTLTDEGVGSEFIQVRDIPFTQVLPLRRGTLYELVVVARVPQASGPPVLIEVDPLEWQSLSYTNTLSQPQELEAACQISSIPESVLIRLRRLAEAATELWLYRNGQIVFAGPLAGWRTSGETLTLQAKGLLSYLRLMVVTADLRFQQADQFTFVTTMIDQWQSQEYGNFGIDTSSAGLSGVLRDGTYLRTELHNVGQRVEELGKRESGFDAEVDPASRKLQLWYPGKGVDRSAGEDAIVIDARNITSGDVMCSVAVGDLASEAYGTGSSAGGDTTLWSEQANVDLRTHYGRSAVTGTWSDVSEQPTLDAHTRGLLDARGEALIVPGPNVRVTPDADLDDYAVGDTIAYSLQSVLGVNGAFRIRSQHVAVSSTGQESVDLEFV